MSKIHRHLSHLALIAGMATLAPSAFAQAFDAIRLYGAAPGQDGGLAGAAVIAGTQYQGSDERRTLVVPVLDYQWTNGWFVGVTNGIGYNFSRRPDMQYGVRLTADFGRKESRSKDLRGMGDVDASAEVGGFFNYSITRDVFLTSSWRYGSGDDNKGALLDLGIGYSTELAPAWRVGVGMAVTMANADYMQSYFGVTTRQANASGYEAYKPDAGIRDARANLSLSYQIDSRTSITTALSASTLMGDAKDSPLVRKKSTVTGVVGVVYAF